MHPLSKFVLGLIVLVGFLAFAARAEADTGRLFWTAAADHAQGDEYVVILNSAVVEYVDWAGATDYLSIQVPIFAGDTMSIFARRCDAAGCITSATITVSYEGPGGFPGGGSAIGAPENAAIYIEGL